MIQGSSIALKTNSATKAWHRQKTIQLQKFSNYSRIWILGHLSSARKVTSTPTLRSLWVSMFKVSNFKEEEPDCLSSCQFSTTGLIHYRGLLSDMASHGVATSYVLEDSSQMLIGNSWNIWSPVISLPSSPTVLQRGWPCSSSKNHTMSQELSTCYSLCKACSSL